MITLNLQVPETVAAEFYQAADDINKRFRDTGADIDAKALMAFALARHDADDVCAQFDLALRMVRGGSAEGFNPVIK
jgi:hypothetical protein